LSGEDGHEQAVVPEKHAAVVFEDAERMASVKLFEPMQQAVAVKRKPVPEAAKTRAEKKGTVKSPVRHGIALILDDVGYDIPALRRAMALGVPMAISILPNAPHAARAASLAHAAGYAVMLHMPMEPTNPHYQKRMDASFIRVGMQRRKVRRMMNEALIRVPFVEGVNNHMGSRLTALAEPMSWVMEVCMEQKLFFVDSRTNKDSVAARVAREAGLSWGERRVFLDDSVEADKLKQSWQAARDKLSRGGAVIVIAHPHSETLDFLEQSLTAADRKAMVPLRRVLWPAATGSVMGHGT